MTVEETPRRVETGWSPDGGNSDSGFVEEPLFAENPRDALRSALKASVALDPVVLGVPGRPNVSVRYNVNIDADKLNHWTNRAKDKNSMDGVNAKRMSVMILADTGLGVLFNGIEAIGEDGKPYTFFHPELLEMLEVKNPQEAVRKLYGVDGHILQTAKVVIDEAGFGDELDLESDEDPT